MIALLTLAVIPVIIFCAEVESVIAPALLPFPAEAIVMVRVTKAGIAELSCAVIVYECGAVGLLTEYFVSALLTAVGADPAAAADTVMVAGEPDTLTCARASLVPTAKAINTAARRMRRLVFALAVM